MEIPVGTGTTDIFCSLGSDLERRATGSVSGNS